MMDVVVETPSDDFINRAEDLASEETGPVALADETPAATPADMPEKASCNGGWWLSGYQFIVIVTDICFCNRSKSFNH